ncbi:hypothetical protein OG819_09455 [Streptomyces sp. NBC_01549]|uniref:hypothetical protein n=1 Tax=Streptomyces sp. NBC_01549 TaxID=2975874 RepID=UPI002253AF97|nr:hypothetical protein [Streptomyces sp. NBC_01549]MCX4589981.1 hypothetical protein [Streptomyces sp. NBC_01549]
MARSTIQDKLSGKSSANLPEVLSIVEALAEHARLNGAPLPSQEIDQGTWRERVTALTGNTPTASTTPYAPTISADPKIPWDVQALRLAQMHDLIEIVENSSDAPTASWLPKVVAPLLLAEMSVVEFMQRASRDSPQAIVQTLVALDRAFPIPEAVPWEARDPWLVSENDRTVGVLLSEAARRHGGTATPAIVVAMRRAEIGEHVDAYLANIARLHPTSNIQYITRQLRTATLSADADKVLRFVGSKRQAGRIFEVALFFHTSGQTDDAKKVLQGTATENWYRIESMVHEIGDHESADDFVREVLRGIPYGKHSEYAEGIRQRGNAELAQRILAAADEPPF